MLEFREYLTTWTLRQITMEFDAADFDPPVEDYVPDSSERRTLIERYYATIDPTIWGHVKKLLIVYENALVTLRTYIDQLTVDDWKKEHERRFENLIRCLGRDGFEYRNGRVTSAASLPHSSAIKEIAVAIDMGYIRRQIERISEAVDCDPDTAIGTAKELVETVCKSILHRRGVSYDEKWDMLTLAKKTREAMKLLPEDIPANARGINAMKSILGSLGAVVHGLAELRNEFGTGHGPVGNVSGLKPRHARLAAGAAQTLAMFLFENDRDRPGQS